MKKFELTHGQKLLAEGLSARVKDRCEALGLKYKNCEPRHFLLLVFKYDGKLADLGGLLDDCLMWVHGNGKLLFTPARFANWCKIEKSKADRRASNFRELDQLKNGNSHQRAEWARRTAPR